MGWKEKYRMWQKGVETDFIHPYRILFFKTNPTDEQIEYLDWYERRTQSFNFSAIGFMTILGFVLGVFWAWLLFKMS
jgi:hypothetical protein